MDPVHLITHDGVRAICGRLDGKRSSFVSLVTCQRCKDWWEANKLPRKIAPQMYEHYTDLRQYSFNEAIVAPKNGRVECALGLEYMSPEDAVWIGEGECAMPVCSNHEAEYRKQLKVLEDEGKVFEEADADMNARLYREYQDRQDN